MDVIDDVSESARSIQGDTKEDEGNAEAACESTPTKVLHPNVNETKDQPCRNATRTEVYNHRKPEPAADRAQFLSMAQQAFHSAKASHAHHQRLQEQDRRKIMNTLCPTYTTITTPKSLPSVTALRSQLQEEFMHTFYSREEGQDWYPSKIILCDTPDTPSFSAATNALYLTQLALSHSDPRLLQNAVRAYQSAIPLLRRDISHPRACENDYLFATIQAMSLCEAFAAVSVDESGRKQHLRGMASLLERRGPQSIRSMYMVVQLQLHQEQALWEGLMTRKRPVIGQGRWLDVRKKCRIKMTELVNTALRIPAVLEAIDVADSEGRLVGTEAIANFMSELKAIELDLLDWMTKQYTQLPHLPYRKIDRTTLAGLPSFHGQASTAFPSALRFQTPAFAKVHLMLWTCLLVLRRELADLASKHPFPLLASTKPQQDQALRPAITTCADDLCMTAMTLCSPRGGMDGYVQVCGPLQLACSWYERMGEVDKFEWCCAMIGFIESKGVRTRDVVSVRKHGW